MDTHHTTFSCHTIILGTFLKQPLTITKDNDFSIAYTNENKICLVANNYIT